MCGRYVPPEVADMERFWKIDRRNSLGWAKPTFNFAPTQEAPILIRAEDGALELMGARWGLIPHWWKKESAPTLTFNARSEEARQKPMWRQVMRSHRCLMPAKGWYEWKAKEQVCGESGKLVKQPYFLFSPNLEVIAFAGLWSVWQSPSGPVVSCALLTTSAAPSITEVYHRMPVVLEPELYETWLAHETSDADVDLAIANARQDFESYRVSTHVNNTRNNSPDLLGRV